MPVLLLECEGLGWELGASPLPHGGHATRPQECEWSRQEGVCVAWVLQAPRLCHKLWLAFAPRASHKAMMPLIRRTSTRTRTHT